MWGILSKQVYKTAYKNGSLQYSYSKIFTYDPQYKQILAHCSTLVRWLKAQKIKQNFLNLLFFRLENINQLQVKVLFTNFYLPLLGLTLYYYVYVLSTWDFKNLIG